MNNNAGADLTSKKDGEDKYENNDNDKDDVQLLWTRDILKRLHEKFYGAKNNILKRNTLTVPTALSQMRRETFHSKTVCVVFSGLIPLCEQTREIAGRKTRSAVQRYAEDLGATVSSTPSVYCFLMVGVVAI